MVCRIRATWAVQVPRSELIKTAGQHLGVYMRHCMAYGVRGLHFERVLRSGIGISGVQGQESI